MITNMGNSQIWQAARYVMVMGGTYLAAKGKIPVESVEPLVDDILQVSGMAIAVGAAGWGLYVRFRTVSVPTAAAVVKDVPMVSGLTGNATRDIDPAEVIKAAAAIDPKNIQINVGPKAPDSIQAVAKDLETVNVVPDKSVK